MGRAVGWNRTAGSPAQPALPHPVGDDPNKNGRRRATSPIGWPGGRTWVTRPADCHAVRRRRTGMGRYDTSAGWRRYHKACGFDGPGGLPEHRIRASREWQSGTWSTAPKPTSASPRHRGLNNSVGTRETTERAAPRRKPVGLSAVGLPSILASVGDRTRAGCESARLFYRCARTALRSCGGSRDEGMEPTLDAGPVAAPRHRLVASR